MVHDMALHIRESNLIEGVDDPHEDALSLAAFNRLMHDEKITPGVVLMLHERAMFTYLPEHRGKLRDVPVWVGDQECPAPHLATEMLHNWVLDMEHYENLDPKEMHVRFEKIHPFVDGNGRVGRMLMWWHEIKLGRAPTLLLNSDKQDYYRWFK